MTTNKKIVFGDEAREKILKGMEIVYKAVSPTLGPKGKIIIIERPGEAPHLTKDGYSIAKSINLKDQYFNMGAQMVKEAASQTVENAGDGTTSATILTYNIYKNGLKLLAAGHNSTEMKKGIDFAVQCVVTNLEKMANPVNSPEDIIHIGTVSANGDRSVGEMLEKAISKVGREGIITVEESKGYETSLEVVQGMRFNRGYTSPYFITNSEKMICELEEPYILITNKKYDQIADLRPLLEQINKINKPLLMIVDDIEGEALHTLSINKVRGTLNVCAIRAPEFGAARFDALEDIALLTNGKIVSNETGIEIKEINVVSGKDTILGRCKKVIVGKNYCTIVGYQDREDAIKQKLADVKKNFEDPTLEQNEKEAIQRRMSRLSGGVAVIRVGGTTEVEMREKKDRIDDALCATQAALESGILPGGGVALVRAGKELIDINGASKDFNAGIEIVRQACISPLTQLVNNVNKMGSGADVVLNTIIQSNIVSYGWDAATEKYCDLLEQGIIEPLKVPKSALMNASSVAGLALTVDALIVEEDLGIFEKKDM